MRRHRLYLKRGLTLILATLRPRKIAILILLHYPYWWGLFSYAFNSLLKTADYASISNKPWHHHLFVVIHLLLNAFLLLWSGQLFVGFFGYKGIQFVYANDVTTCAISGSRRTPVALAAAETAFHLKLRLIRFVTGCHLLQVDSEEGISICSFCW